MSLPLLIGGSAECGPSVNNPLRGLTKTFDKDRGIQQVRIISPQLIPRYRLTTWFYLGFFRSKPLRLLQPGKTFLLLRLDGPSHHVSCSLDFPDTP